MPGITGCLRLSSADAISADFGKRAVRPLVREDTYTSRLIIAEADVHAIVVGPSLCQPVLGAALDEEADTAIGYYGEFFLPELRDLEGDSLAAALLRLYKEHGFGLPRILDGSFVVFVWDRARRQALLFNDHVGSRRVYYCEQNGRLYFSPEPKGIARLNEVHTEFDELAFITFLSQGNLLDCQSYYKEIRSLPPGSLIRSDHQGFVIEHYYTYLPCDETARDKGIETYVDGLRCALVAACRKRAHRLRRTVIPISGGFDSRGILACMAEISGQKLTTVSWGTREDVPGADAYVGRKVAEHFGTRHTFFKRDPIAFGSDVAEMVERVDGSTSDPAEHHHELQIMRAIRDQVGADYLLRGDEVLGFLGQAGSEKEALAAIGIRELMDYRDLLKLLRADLQADAVERFRQLLSTIAAECPLRDYTARKDYYYFSQRMANYLHRATYYKLSVLEVANPLLDKDILNFYRSVPVRYRVQKMLYRRTLEAMFPEIMRIPMATQDSLENWDDQLANDRSLQQFILFHLLENRNALHELLDGKELEQLVRAAVQGRKMPPARLRYLEMMKDAIAQVAPGLYRAIKNRAFEKTHFGFIPPRAIVFRLVVLKLWFDTCA